MQALLQGLGGLRVVQGFTPLVMGQLLLVLEEGVSALVLHLQETPGTLVLLLCHSQKPWPRPSRATSSR